MTYSHIPVLIGEMLELIDPISGENLVDGTVGGGGHSKAILERTGPDGKLLGIDMDADAIEASKINLEDFGERVTLKRDNFINFVRLKDETGFGPINIFVLDLGISSKQLDDELLGISFLKNSPLDMRLGRNDLTGERSAGEIVNKYSEEAIFNIIKEYGEEKYAKNIAKGIVDARREKRIFSTGELVNIIENAVPEKYKHARIHCATRTFQALRIAVNRELENLEKAMPLILENIESGGRIAVISFHSLEDRIVKRFFVKESKDCICGPDVPVCLCDHKRRLEIITKKPVRPSNEEVYRNPRSRSARLRIAKKI